MNRWPTSLCHILAVLWLALIASPLAAQAPDFRQVFENHGAAMLLVDPAAGQIVDANPAAARFYGHGRDALKAMNIQQINTLSAEQVTAERALAESEGRNYFIFRHQLANGEIRTVEVYSHPFSFDGRRLLLSMIHDITAGRNREQGMWHYQERLEALVDARSAEATVRRHMVFLLLAGLLATSALSLTLFLAVRRRKRAEDRLRESEDRYRDLVEHNHDLICTHDLQGRILSANPAAMKLLGIAPDVLVKMNLRDLMAPEVRDRFADYLATIQRDGRASGLMLVQTSSGEKRLWEYDNTLRTQGVAAPLVRGMARDISERKRNEDELKQKLAELRDLHEAMLGREERVLELKREADALRQRLGEPQRYAVELADEQPAAGAPS